MHVVRRSLSAALVLAASAAATPPGTHASPLLPSPSTPNLLHEPAHGWHADPVVLRTFLDAAAGTTVEPRAILPAAGTAADPDAPLEPAHLSQPQAEMFAPRHAAALLLPPPPPHAPGGREAALALPASASLFLAGGLLGALIGLAFASLVVGTNGPDLPQPNTDHA